MNQKAPRVTKPAPLSLRLTPGLNERLEEAAEKTKIKKYNLAILAIEAAVEAIENNDYRIVMPIAFDVKSVAVAVSKETYPPAREEVVMLAERPGQPAQKPIKLPKDKIN